jgi:lysyl-tRNA synthetase class 2
MQYTISEALFSLFPLFQRGVVIAKNIDNSTLDAGIAHLLSESARAVTKSSNGASDPRLEVWDQAYRVFGADPKKDTPSIRFLITQIEKGKMPRSINNLVDSFNIISLKYRLPCGGDDLDALTGDIHLGLAKGTELFAPLFRPEMSEHPRPGEVIYCTPADGRTMCRRWNWRNAHFSRIRPETLNVVVNIDAMVPPLDRCELSQATEELTTLIRRYCGGEITTHILDRFKPTFTI